VPEGHTIHRLAADHTERFGGRVVRASSPQGRFADGARAIDGAVLRRVEANGKHLLQYYQHGPVLHVHLGLYGHWSGGALPAPEPRGALRVRIMTDEQWLVRVSLVSGGRQMRVPCDPRQYEKLRPGDHVEVSYREGNYTGTIWSAEIK